MSENIVDKNLSRILKLKLCVDEIYSIEEIEDLCIQDINLMQIKLNIDLTEIVKIKNLKSLSIKFFEITDSVIDSINQLEYLENIEFSMCIFKNKKTLDRKIKSLTIYNCENFDIGILDKNIPLEELELIHSGIVKVTELNNFKSLKKLKLSNCIIISLSNIAEIKNLEKLYLNNTEIQYDIDISNMKNLEFISFNGSNIINKKEYIEKLYKQNNNVTITCEEDDLPIE